MVTSRNATYSCHIFGFEDFYESRTAEYTLWTARPSIHPGTSVNVVYVKGVHKMLSKIPAKHKSQWIF